MGGTPKGIKAKAAIMLGQGFALREIAEECGINRTTLWSWRRDDEEFKASVQKVIDTTLEEARQRLRSLADKSVQAFEDALGDEDVNVALKAADMVTRRIPELMPQQGVEMNLDANEQIAALIRRLDGPGTAGTGADGGAPPPAP